MTSQELDLGCYDNGSVKQNYIPIRTIKQPEPKIQLAQLQILRQLNFQMVLK